jgi:Queuosine salvage protein
VRIDELRIESVAQSVAALPAPPAPSSDVAYAITVNAVTFGSGWHPHVQKLPGRSGAQTMMTRLRQRFDTDGPFTAGELASLTAADCAALFGQELRPPVDELMALFARSLNDLGRFLLDRFDGSFDVLVAAADRSGVRLVELLCAMPMYRDVASYQGEPVPFLKRAQLTASDVGGSTDSSCFDDLDRLTLFADNLIPHVLRLEGVLVFDDDLVAHIGRGELLDPGGQAETEMRACAVHAAELMVESLAGACTASELDNRLWHRGQDPRFKAVPRPRARSLYY